MCGKEPSTCVGKMIRLALTNSSREKPHHSWFHILPREQIGLQVYTDQSTFILTTSRGAQIHGTGFFFFFRLTQFYFNPF